MAPFPKGYKIIPSISSMKHSTLQLIRKIPTLPANLDPGMQLTDLTPVTKPTDSPPVQQRSLWVTLA